MSKTLPDLLSPFRKDCEQAVSFPASLETLAVRVKPTRLAHRHLSPPKLEAAYEHAFVKCFMAWERLNEDSFLRFMCDYRTTSWTPTLLHPPASDPSTALASLLEGKRTWLSWYPRQTIERSEAHFQEGRHEKVILSALPRLESMAQVRHRVVHSSSEASRLFESATKTLCGERFPTPGSFLRHAVPSIYPRVLWLHRFRSELEGLAAQLVG